MRHLLVSLTAACVLAAACLATKRADATTISVVTGADEAVDAETHLADKTGHVCRHREYSSRRVCWWRVREP
jgi:hypothetical protein